MLSNSHFTPQTTIPQSQLPFVDFSPNMSSVITLYSYIPVAIDTLTHTWSFVINSITTNYKVSRVAQSINAVVSSFTSLTFSSKTSPNPSFLTSFLSLGATVLQEITLERKERGGMGREVWGNCSSKDWVCSLCHSADFVNMGATDYDRALEGK